jgi:hypothetical protein
VQVLSERSKRERTTSKRVVAGAESHTSSSTERRNNEEKETTRTSGRHLLRFFSSSTPTLYPSTRAVLSVCRSCAALSCGFRRLPLVLHLCAQSSSQARKNDVVTSTLPFLLLLLRLDVPFRQQTQRDRRVQHRHAFKPSPTRSSSSSPSSTTLPNVDAFASSLRSQSMPTLFNVDEEAPARTEQLTSVAPSLSCSRGTKASVMGGSRACRSVLFDVGTDHRRRKSHCRGRRDGEGVRTSFLSLPSFSQRAFPSSFCDV